MAALMMLQLLCEVRVTTFSGDPQFLFRLLTSFAKNNIFIMCQKLFSHKRQRGKITQQESPTPCICVCNARLAEVNVCRCVESSRENLTHRHSPTGPSPCCCSFKPILVLKRRRRFPAPRSSSRYPIICPCLDFCEPSIDNRRV